MGETSPSDFHVFNYRVALFSLTVLSYCVILVLNVSLILTIILDENLHEPMYICLCILFINELYGTTGFFLKFAFDLLSDVHVISYVGCFLQIFVIYSYAFVDYSFLVLMAYDRYVAIFALSWLVPLCCAIIGVTLTSTLQLCGSHIEKLYCENWAVVKLACSSTKANEVYGLFVITFYIGHFLFIVGSYVRLVKSALKSRESRRKFTQTCVPHLLCLFNVTAALLFDNMYSRYGLASVPVFAVVVSLEFVMIPPLLNPLIYGLKLPEIRKNIVRMLSCLKSLP
uniref:G-protein coupled receptors family 1 profile domain-containing protein n=1 Tax=Monopterus albus TaxID=43700 RepID=A0A3Q3K7F2_MONAL